jgi:RNA polymerase sigma factor (sigma-70 family)
MRDAAPVSTALHAEDRAFESLYRLHRPLVYAYAFSKLRHGADAEDVTQTTFLNAYNALHRGVSPREPTEWLLAITRNACRDRFREAKRRSNEEPLADWISIVQPEEPDFSVREICREISELNPRHRQILLMREFEGRSYAEISAELGTSEAGVQALLRRARRSLRDELELGMTCVHARRVALRDLNGVAVLDERRALKRHLRRCTDCATFMGHGGPRTPVARGLWLTTMPFRRILAIFSGSSAAPVGSTAGGAGALAVKLVTLGAVGTAAVGVSVKELGTDTSQHARPLTPTRAIPSHKHHSTGTAPSYAATTFVRFHTPVPQTALSRGKPHTAHLRTTPFAGSTSSAAQPTIPSLWLPSAPAQPATPAAADPPQDNPPDTASAPDTGIDSSSAAATAPATAAPAVAGSSDPSAPDASNLAPPQADASTSAAGASPATTPVSAPDTSTPTNTATIPSSPTPNPGHGNANGIGNGNAVGPTGTPPGQATKPDVAHGRP